LRGVELIGNPKVSVILTSYNHEKFLRESIDSVLNQTFKDYELIICDDASTDHSWNIICSYDDPRIISYRNKINIVRGNLNKMIEQVARGEYIAIHHSDDVWEPTKLEMQVHFLDTHPDTGAVFTNAHLIGENGDSFDDPSHFLYNIFDQPNRDRFEWLNSFFYKGNVLCHPSVLIRKICYDECGTYRNGFIQDDDFDLWVRVCLKYEIHVIPEKLVRFRILSNEMNVSGNRPETRIRSRYEYFQLLDNFLKIPTYQELVKIFPVAQKYYHQEGFDIGYILGRVALETTEDEFKQLFGLNLLFRAINDPNRMKKISKLYGFNQKEFFPLAAHYDVFSIKKKTDLYSQVAEREQQLRMLAGQYQEFASSKVWRAALLARRLRVRLLPPGSLLQHLARKISPILFFPFNLRQNRLRNQEISMIRASDLFDPDWYLAHNPDVAQAGVNPLIHYIQYGGFEGRDPSPSFSSTWYLEAYEDVKKADINPLIHFLKYGRLENRKPLPTQDKEQLPRTSSPNNVEENKIKAKLQVFLSTGASLELPIYTEPVVSIILLFYNQAAMSLQCLETLALGAGSIPFEVVIIDNASTDETSELLERINNAKIIRNPANLGFAGGCNQAVDLAIGKYLLFLNNDVELLPNSIKIMVDTFENGTNIGAVGGKLIFPDGRLQEAGAIIWRDGSNSGYGRYDDPLRPEYSYMKEVDYCSGALLLTPRHIFLSLGKFDTEYRPAYYEDIDYCLQLWRKGFRVVFQPFAVCIHYEFGSLGKAKAFALQKKNQDKFIRKWQGIFVEFYPRVPSNIFPSREHKSNSKRILFIDDRILDYHLGSSYPRSFRILQVLADAGYRITFLPLQNTGMNPVITHLLQLKGIEVLYTKDDQKIDLVSFLKSRTDYYDITFLSRPHNMQEAINILLNHAKQTTIIYDAEALFSLREIKYNELIGRHMTEAEKEKLIQNEVSLTTGASIVTTVTDNEKNIFMKYGAASPHVLGDIIEVNPTPASFDERRNILFVGRILENPSPNEDAVRYFVNQIFPLVRKVVECEFYIVGTNNVKDIWDMESDCVHVIRKVDDLIHYYNRCRLFVVPTRYSAGSPYKMIEAAAYGLPAVVTPLIAARLGWRENRDILVGHDAIDFGQKVIELYSNPNIFYSLRQNALDRIREEYNSDKFKINFENILTLAMDKRKGLKNN
jgi:O-antigen biosynthesis protein